MCEQFSLDGNVPLSPPAPPPISRLRSRQQRRHRRNDPEVTATSLARGVLAFPALMRQRPGGDVVGATIWRELGDVNGLLRRPLHLRRSSHRRAGEEDEDQERKGKKIRSLPTTYQEAGDEGDGGDMLPSVD
uniref:Uncharacterized protein n=1 Tax=Triticum urartu TaxID=4572 RepID=A0A8R7R007_TRIUA